MRVRDDDTLVAWIITAIGLLAIVGILLTRCARRPEPLPAPKAPAALTAPASVAGPLTRERIVNRCPRDNSQAPYWRILNAAPWLNVPCLKFQTGDKVYQMPSLFEQYMVQARSDAQLPPRGTLVYIIGQGPVAPEPVKRIRWKVTFHFERLDANPRVPDTVTINLFAGGVLVGNAQVIAPPAVEALDYDFQFSRAQLAAGISAKLKSDGARWYWPKGEIKVEDAMSLWQ